MTCYSRNMQRSPSKLTLRIHIRTFINKQFDDFLVTPTSRLMQRSRAFLGLRIHIRTVGD